MAYQPVSKPKTGVGYVPVTKKTPELSGFFPIKEQVVRATASLPATPEKRSIGQMAKELVVPGRGFTDTEINKADATLKDRAVGAAKAAGEIGVGLTSLVHMGGNYLADKILPGYDAEKTKQSREKVLEKVTPFITPKNAGEAQTMRIADIAGFAVGWTKAGKLSTLNKALVKVDNIEDARKVLRSGDLTDDVITKLKLDEAAVAIKTPKEAAAFVKRVDDVMEQASKVAKPITPTIAKQEALPPLPKLPIKSVATKIDNIPTPTVAKLEVTPEVQKTLDSIQQWISSGARGKMTTPVLSKIDNLNIKPAEPVSLYRVGDVTDKEFQSWSKIKPPEGVKFTEKVFTPDEILVDTTDPRLVEAYSGLQRETIQQFNKVEGEVIVKPLSLRTTKPVAPTLPTLPKLPPEMVKALETRQSDKVVLDAVKERYAKAVSRTPDENTKLAKSALTKGKDGIMKLSSEILTPISSRLGRISVGLKSGLREYESLSLLKIKKDTDAVEPLLRKMKAMPKDEYAILDLAMKNSDMEVVDAIARKYGLTDDMNEFRLVWDDLFQRGNEVGMDIAYRKNTFPRLLKNPEGYMNYLRGTEDWGVIDNLIRAEAEKKGIRYTDMTDADKAEIVNNFVRGYGDKTTLAAPSPTKARTIEVVDENLAQFYEDTPTAIINYITRMNDDIEARKFFGKNLDNFDGATDLESNVGALILKGLASGEIQPNQVDEISKIIRARFKRGKMNGGLQVYRNAELVSTMGSITSAVTQLGDVVWSVFKNGGYQTTKAALGKKKITREMLGIDNHIMYEFNDTGFGKKMVDGVFKYTGMNNIIKFFQDTSLTANLGKWQSMAKKDEALLREDLLSLVLPERIDGVVDALKNGYVSEDLKIALTARLLDFQPLTKSEFPQKYLEMPNGRIFWMLKSFTLKQYDIFRREAVDDIIKGASSGNAKLAAKGAKNLVYLATLFMAANATSDEIKDLILGRETPPSDRLVDNLWRLIGASKFDVYQAKENGVGATLMKKILPPVSIADSLGKDVYNTVTGKEYEKGPLKGESYDLETTQRIPIVGKPYYWWFGRGAQKEEYKQGTSTTETGGALPPLPKLPTLPALPKLPKI